MYYSSRCVVHLTMALMCLSLVSNDIERIEHTPFICPLAVVCFFTAEL